MVLTVLFYAGDAQSDTSHDPLAGFSPAIGGQWHLAGSYTELEWGVGRRGVNARRYFVVDGQPKLVSEGAWKLEDDLHYSWTLTSEMAEGHEHSISGTHVRK